MKLEGSPKEQVARLTTLLPVGKEVAVSFGGGNNVPTVDSSGVMRFKHSDTTKLLEVKLATQDSIKKAGGNLPDKRKNSEGKDYTPAIVSIVFESFVLDVVLEDIDFELTLSPGIRMNYPWGVLEIKE